MQTVKAGKCRYTFEQNLTIIMLPMLSILCCVICTLSLAQKFVFSLIICSSLMILQSSTVVSGLTPISVVKMSHLLLPHIRPLGEISPQHSEPLWT